MSEITIPAMDGSGSFKGYIAMPDKLPAPALIMIQEIFGVNQEMRDKCDEMAAQGYVSICPDLFWRLEPGVQLTDKTEEEWNRAFDLMNRFDIDKGIEDLRATMHILKGHAECTGKVGCVGYCLGGKLAYLMAARTQINASVGYYGVGLEELIGEAANIQNPLLLHIAELDKFSSGEAIAKIKEGLAPHKLVTIYSYPDADHAFARGGGEHYDEQAATQANQRTRHFLKQVLDLAQAD